MYLMKQENISSFVKSRPWSPGLFKILCDEMRSHTGTRAMYQSACARVTAWVEKNFFMNHHFYLKEQRTGTLVFHTWPFGRGFSCKWTKWACHFKGSTIQLYLLPKSELSNKNYNFGKLICPCKLVNFPIHNEIGGFTNKCNPIERNMIEFRNFV